MLNLHETIQAAKGKDEPFSRSACARLQFVFHSCQLSLNSLDPFIQQQPTVLAIYGMLIAASCSPPPLHGPSVAFHQMKAMMAEGLTDLLKEKRRQDGKSVQAAK